LDRIKRIRRKLTKPIIFSGIGVHTGERTNVRFLPASDGIYFTRNGRNDIKIEASIQNVVDSFHGTTIGNGTINFSMVEHILASLFAFGIDSVIIETEGGYEIPILDGSAAEIAEKLNNAVVESHMDNDNDTVVIEDPFIYNNEDKFCAVYPSTKFIVSYLISYKNYPELTQMKTIEITKDKFVTEIAPARTYAFLEWVEPLKKHGLIKGGTLENSLVYSKDGLLNKTPLRFPDEFVRHKILDFIGDLSLLKKRIIGHFVVLCGGHTTHIAFLKALKKVL